MVILLRRNRIRLLALLMAATAAGILWTAHRDAAAASAAAPARAADGWTIVLDAGHGGEDGGAVSRGGVPGIGKSTLMLQMKRSAKSSAMQCPNWKKPNRG